jgi:hypothetical protein
MKRQRDIVILIGLFVVLVVFTLLGPARSRNDSAISKPTTHSSAPEGALAMLRWLDDLGYDARRLEYTSFALDDEAAALVMLNPTEPINQTQTDLVLDWVAQGGLLILANDVPWFFGSGRMIMQELEIGQSEYSDNFDQIERAPVAQPILTAPPLSDALVQTNYVLEVQRDDVAVVVNVPAPDGEPAEPAAGEPAAEEEDATTLRAVVVGIKHGRGYMYISSAAYPFTNAGLRDEANAALVLNMLRRVPPGGQVLFDEWHHGYFEPPSLRSAILSNPWGQATVYALVVFALYLVFTGRRFGKPVPLREEIQRRSSAEYVWSMADLFQRSKKRDFILQHYYIAYKRRLARPYGINPRLDDAAFLAELKRYGEIDTERVRAMLARLRRKDVSEDELVRTVAAMEKEDTRAVR